MAWLVIYFLKKYNIIGRVSILNKIYEDKEYINLVWDIMNNEHFLKLKDNKHHGLTRYEHSIKVSYFSYKLAKKLKLNYQETARAGLLHDFFDNGDLTPKQRKFSVFYHPYKSLENATNTFYLSDMGKDIIITHMFPAIPYKIPKYAESWLVSTIDKLVATYEFGYSYSRLLSYKLPNLYILLLLISTHTIL